MHDLINFTPEAYDAVAAVRSACRPEFPLPVDAFRARDQARAPQKPLQRVMARVDGVVVAYAEIGQEPYDLDPTRHVLNVYVDPRHQGRGIGTALFDELERRIARLDVRELHGGHREDHSFAAAFAAHRGFEPSMRSIFSRVTLASVVRDDAPALPANSEDNHAMLGLNRRLGFETLVAYREQVRNRD